MTRSFMLCGVYTALSGSHYDQAIIQRITNYQMPNAFSEETGFLLTDDSNKENNIYLEFILKNSKA